MHHDVSSGWCEGDTLAKARSQPYIQEEIRSPVLTLRCALVDVWLVLRWMDPVSVVVGSRRSVAGSAASPSAAASHGWAASRRLSSGVGVRISLGPAAAPQPARLVTAALGNGAAADAAVGDEAGGGLARRLSGRIGLGGGLSRLSLSITDALRRLSIRCLLTLVSGPCNVRPDAAAR